MGQLNPDFEGETVVITGATSGIGRAVALAFAEAGATVLIGDIEQEPKDGDVPTADLIEEAGGRAEFVHTDVSEYDQLVDLVETAHDYGGVDVMVNNAAVFLPESIKLDDDHNDAIRSIMPAEFDKIFAVNVRGCFFGTQVAANDMIERDEPGTIVNTASISSNLAQHDQVHYDATKGAVRMITRGSALELAQYDIRVNAVAPGQIATEFVQSWSDLAFDMVEGGELIKPVPLDRPGTPEDVTDAYLFVASDAAEYVTGELLHVDGGWQII